MLAGSTEAHKINMAGLDALCTGFPNYVNAVNQTANPNLAPALASATSISAAPPKQTQPTSNTNAGHRALGLETASLVAMALTATVVLATNLVI